PQHAMTSSADNSKEQSTTAGVAQQPQPLPALNNVPPEAVPLTEDGGVFKLILNREESSTTGGATTLVEAESRRLGDGALDWPLFWRASDGQVYGTTRGDSQGGAGEGVTFKLDNGESLKALELCLPTMQPGQLCRLYARSDYAFGDETDDHSGCCNGSCKSSASAATATAASGRCAGPNADVVMDVELIDWRGDDISANKNGSLLRSVARHGEAEGYCPGIEAALCKMYKSELANIWLLDFSELGFGAEGCADLSVPPNANLVYQIELLDFVKPKEVWQLNRLEKIAEAESAKARSVACLTAGNLRLAFVHCKRVVDYLEWDADFQGDADLQAQRHRLLLAGRLNLALACLKTRRFQQAVTQCSAVLEKLDSKNEKALYRRGQARLETCDFDLAAEDFRACLAVNSSNSAAKAGLQRALDGAKQVEQRERRRFAGMFDRFAQQDAKNKPGGDEFAGSDFTIDTWDNSLADGMLSIPQELEAFGEEMPQKKRSGGGVSAIAECKDEN
uniref:peptidylprolyl isomerase n=1 Tax=Macrostomum lignano TaxID=282301 RepID=A0A1I8GZ41_9PLAT